MVCKECKELCDYYLDEFWNCQGESEPCPDFFNRNEFFNRGQRCDKDGEQDDGHNSDEPEYFVFHG